MSKKSSTRPRLVQKAPSKSTILLELVGIFEARGGRVTDYRVGDIGEIADRFMRIGQEFEHFGDSSAIVAIYRVSTVGAAAFERDLRPELSRAAEAISRGNSFDSREAQGLADLALPPSLRVIAICHQIVLDLAIFVRDIARRIFAQVSDFSASVLPLFHNENGSGTLDLVGRIQTKRENDLISLVEERLTALPMEQLLQRLESRLIDDLNRTVIAQDASRENVLHRLEGIALVLDRLHDVLRPAIGDFTRAVNALPEESRTMGSLEGNKHFASLFQRILSVVGERLCCPTCGKPSTLLCRKSNSPTGSFVFGHSEAGVNSQHGGWSRLPELKIMVVKPLPDKRL